MPNQAIRYIPHGPHRGMAPFISSSAHVTVWCRDTIVAQYQQIERGYWRANVYENTATMVALHARTEKKIRRLIRQELGVY